MAYLVAHSHPWPSRHTNVRVLMRLQGNQVNRSGFYMSVNEHRTALAHPCASRHKAIRGQKALGERRRRANKTFSGTTVILGKQ